MCAEDKTQQESPSILFGKHFILSSSILIGWINFGSRSVQLALDGPYLPLVKILRAKLAHMRSGFRTG